MTSFNRFAVLALGLLTIASPAPALATSPPGELRPFASATALPRNIDSTYGVTLRSTCTAPAWPSAASRSDALPMPVSGPVIKASIRE
jgi:hypothetical protein